MFASKDIFLKSSGGYTISRSVRLRSSASAYLNRTPASSTNTKTWTWSGWFKNSTTAVDNTFIDGFVDVNNETVLRTSGNQISFAVWTSGAYTVLATTPAVFRDPSAWYHIVFVLDTTQATNSNGVKVYVNGVQQTLTFTNYTQNATTLINTTNSQRIGRSFISGGDRYTDGYLTEINFIDGQALTPSSFGTTNALTGVWQPAKYTGTYGTNGFYLNFSDNSGATATTIGKDYSGNGNNWTPNNISVTAGTTYDSMIDVPTLYADGGNGRGNYAVLNPLQTGSYVTQSNGNLTNTGNTATNSALVLGTIGELTSGKWYWEYTQGTVGSETCGIVTTYTPGTSLLNGENIGAFGIGARANGAVYGGTVGTITSWTTGDVIGLAVDCDNGAIYWSKNGTWLNSGVPTSGASKTGAVGTWTPAAAKVTPAFGAFNGGFVNVTFGQRPFAYTPPSGFVALNTQNLPTPTISNGATVMAASTYTGTGATQTIANSGNNAGSISFKPDLVWIKSRSAATNNNLFDSVRGTTNYLISNSTAAEATNANTLTAFGTTGFTLGSDASALGVNVNAATYVAWQWQAGQGSTSSNTSGSITSTVSVNATAGFSIVTYTGTGSAATIGHGLGVAPKMIIVKNRSFGTYSWTTWHGTFAANQYVYINGTDAVATATGPWNNTLPTSSVFSVGADLGTNRSGDNYVVYCFTAIAGYSAFGKYTGNGSADGPFVYLGFRPRWVMIKRTDSAGFDWNIVDTSRNTYNVTTSRLWADLSNAEDSTDNVCDITSNGFKLRSTNTNTNASGGTYIYMAVAENPFKISLAR